MPSPASINQSAFDYDRAFSRNIGWVTVEEQHRLQRARVAVAGLGGVGGAHVMTLARLGIAHFNIADFDSFEVHNFNRQAGAFMSTLERPKAEVIGEMARDINPQAEVRRFDAGVTPDNVDEFLRDVDVYVDGIDFFAVDARRMIFAACHERGIAAVTAAPLGLSTALLCFLPGKMSFENYFRLEGCERQEQYARFIAGLSPAMLHAGYLAVPGAVDFASRSGPSIGASCDLCAGVVGTTVLKLLLGRGTIRPAPWSMQFDAYRQRMSYSWRPFGNANPIQRVLLRLIRHRLNPG